MQNAVRMSSMSCSQLYRDAVDQLNQADIATAKQEALWIVEEALGVSRLQLHTYVDDSIDYEAYQRVQTLIKRRASGEPLQYVLGSQEFLGLEMMVDPGVLIPRPESELLVEEVITRMRPHPQPMIVDVGTGSGCLAISVARALCSALVIASDRSLEALRVARMNALKHNVHSRILWLAGDLLAPLFSSRLAGKVTGIIANLPYISHDEWDRLSPDVKDFEPRLALDGGPDGLDFYRRLLEEAPSVLASKGVVCMEIGRGQVDDLCEEVAASSFFEVIKIQPDLQGIPRMVCVQRVGQL